MKRDDLLKKAEKLGVHVDGRWSDERIQSEIDKKQSEQPTDAEHNDAPEIVSQPSAPDVTPQVALRPVNMGPQPTTVPGESRNEQPPPSKGGNTPIRLMYDTWFKEDERTRAGAVVKVDVETAKRLIREGKAERADPLPGEHAA